MHRLHMRFGNRLFTKMMCERVCQVADKIDNASKEITWHILNGISGFNYVKALILMLYKLNAWASLFNKYKPNTDWHHQVEGQLAIKNHLISLVRESATPLLFMSDSELYFFVYVVSSVPIGGLKIFRFACYDFLLISLTEPRFAFWVRGILCVQWILVIFSFILQILFYDPTFLLPFHNVEVGLLKPFFQFFSLMLFSYEMDSSATGVALPSVDFCDLNDFLSSHWFTFFSLFCCGLVHP